MPIPTPPQLTRRDDGRWLDGGRPLIFAARCIVPGRRTPIHILTEESLAASPCGKARPGSAKFARFSTFTHPPAHHRICHLCDYTGHFRHITTA